MRNRVLVNPGDANEKVVGVSNNEFGVGGKITNLTGGGGGWGNPFEREPERVLQDVIQGYVSLDAAERDYGVKINAATLTVDLALTNGLRSRKNGKS